MQTDLQKFIRNGLTDASQVMGEPFTIQGDAKTYIGTFSDVSSVTDFTDISGHHNDLTTRLTALAIQFSTAPKINESIIRLQDKSKWKITNVPQTSPESYDLELTLDEPRPTPARPISTP